MAERRGSDSSRDLVLTRIRTALADAAPPHPAPAPVPGRRSQDPAERFSERLAEYRATAHRVGPAALPALLAQLLARHGARRLAVPAAVPSAWLPAELEAVRDEPPLTPRQLDALDGVLTGCALAVAETGTIVLDHGADQGRRALTLLPDLHICVVTRAKILDDLPDAFAALTAPIDAGRPLTLISGPSATSDIELNRVEGVHGPRRLEVVILEAPA